jgi:hypothetical protein
LLQDKEEIPNIPPDKKACEPYREELAIMAGLFFCA